MRFTSYIYISAALLLSAYASPLPDESNAGEVTAQSGDIITKLDLAAARAQLGAEDAMGLEIRAGGGNADGACIVA